MAHFTIHKHSIEFNPGKDQHLLLKIVVSTVAKTAFLISKETLCLHLDLIIRSKRKISLLTAKTSLSYSKWLTKPSVKCYPSYGLWYNMIYIVHIKFYLIEFKVEKILKSVQSCNLYIIFQQFVWNEMIGFIRWNAKKLLNLSIKKSSQGTIQGYLLI